MSRKRDELPGTPSRRELAGSRREARRRRRRVRTITLVCGAFAVVGTLIAWGAVNAANRPGQPVAYMGNLHIELGTQSPVAYNSSPPTSGPHYQSIARWGVHAEPIPDELMVHNLEDGGVGIWYDCPDDCSELEDQLQSIAQRYHDGVLLAPYQGMDSRIALTAWARIDKLDAYDEARIVRFVQAYRGDDHHVRQ